MEPEARALWAGLVFSTFLPSDAAKLEPLTWRITLPAINLPVTLQEINEITYSLALVPACTSSDTTRDLIFSWSGKINLSIAAEFDVLQLSNSLLHTWHSCSLDLLKWMTGIQVLIHRLCTCVSVPMQHTTMNRTHLLEMITTNTRALSAYIFSSTNTSIRIFVLLNHRLCFQNHRNRL